MAVAQGTASGGANPSLASWISRTIAPTRCKSCGLRGGPSRASRPGTYSSTKRPCLSRPLGSGTSTPARFTARMNSITPSEAAVHGFRTVEPTRTTAPLALPPASNSSPSVTLER